MRCPEHISPGNARRKQRTTHDLVPVEANSGLHEHSFEGRPAVLDVGAGFQIITVECSRRRQDTAAIKRAVRPKQQKRLILILLREVDLINFSSELYFVTPELRKRIQKNIGNSLRATRGAMELLKVVSLIGIGRNYKRIRALRVVLVTKRIPCE